MSAGGLARVFLSTGLKLRQILVQASGDCCPPQSASNPAKPNVPHSVSEATGYEYTGRYDRVGDYEKVYLTGPDDAKHAIVVIYDIFGFCAKLEDRLPEVLDFAQTLKKTHSRVSILGYCWAMIAPEDGNELTVPLGFYPSKLTFRHHGWAAARANLNDAENLKQYEDVYQRTADYFTAVKC
ncbi:uncharacterized protein I303_107346 [Kwoniella dejecticola CBS 10117]|uniref:Dienelactone hydrolase domain-containing protein n=1 Tax=Kwoniella dejecticola CBS 10117 TaxID=1296121 RepID=A0AAJ8KW73_9TREE